MFSTNVEYFCEIWFLLYEKIMRFSPWKIGKYTRWASWWGQYSWVAAIHEDYHLCTEISKRRTIMQATVSVGVCIFRTVEYYFPYKSYKFLLLHKNYGNCKESYCSTTILWSKNKKKNFVFTSKNLVLTSILINKCLENCKIVAVPLQFPQKTW